MEPFEIMISESQERMAAVVEPARLDDVAAVCAKWDLPCTVIGRVVDGDTMTCRFDGEVVGELPVASLVDHCPRYPVHGTRPERLADDARRRRRLPAARRRRRHAADAAGRAQHRLEGLGLRPVRPVRRLRLDRPARRRRRRRAPDAVRPCDRRGARRQRPPRLARSAPRRRRGRLRGGPQRRLRGRRAGRDHELPQLRQPGARRDAVHADRGDRGHRRGLRGVRHPGRVRQRLALQRDRRDADPAHADGRLPGRARVRLPRRRAAPSGRRATSILLLADGAPALDGSEYQRTVLRSRRGTDPGPRPRRHRAHLRERSPTPPAAACCAPRTTSPTAASP